MSDKTFGVVHAFENAAGTVSFATDVRADLEVQEIDSYIYLIESAPALADAARDVLPLLGAYLTNSGYPPNEALSDHHPYHRLRIAIAKSRGAAEEGAR